MKERISETGIFFMLVINNSNFFIPIQRPRKGKFSKGKEFLSTSINNYIRRNLYLLHYGFGFRVLPFQSKHICDAEKDITTFNLHRSCFVQAMHFGFFLWQKVDFISSKNKRIWLQRKMCSQVPVNSETRTKLL